MTIKERVVWNALKEVQDPDIGKDLVSLNMIEDLVLTNKRLSFTIMLTTPACPLKNYLENSCKSAINEVSSELEVHIDFKSRVLMNSSQNVLPNVKNIIAIASGKGGVGKSTLVTNIALSLQLMGCKIGVIDGDIFGPSIPTMFNTETDYPKLIKVEGKNRMLPVEKYGIKLLSIGYMSSQEEAVVWRGPMASAALKQFITETEWGDLDYLIVDLPPGTSDISLTLVQTLSLTGAVIITTPQKIATLDAQKAIQMFMKKQIQVPILGIIENMSFFEIDDEKKTRHYIFGKNGGKELSEKYNLPFIGEIPIYQAIQESGNRGIPVTMTDNKIGSIFRDIGAKIAQQISIKNLPTLE